MFLKNWRKLRVKPVAVFGAGISGKGICKLLTYLDWGYRLYDHEGLHFDEEEAKLCSFVISSPGFKLNHRWRIIAEKMHIKVISDIDFSSYFINSRIIGITGTNGKSTVATFLAHHWNRLGLKAICAGNIGTPLSECIIKGSDVENIFLEISSFQSKDMVSTKLESLLWTNFDEDHLDYHESVEEYFFSKAKLFNLIDNDKVFVGRTVSDFAKKIGYELPEGVKVIEADKNKFNFKKSNLFLETYPQRENIAMISEFLKNEKTQSSEIEKSISTYQPEPHRLQKIGTIQNAHFWNDSKSTNFASTLAACKNFDGNVYWIGGGKIKGGKIKEFARNIIPLINRAFLIGESAPLLAKIFNKEGLPYAIFNSIEQALIEAYEEVSTITNILLSPGFASYDLFKNFEDRGNCFEKSFLHLKQRISITTDKLLNKSFAH